MEFELDSAKSAINKNRHGIDFVEEENQHRRIRPKIR